MSNQNDEIIDDFSEALRVINDLVQVAELNMDEMEDNTVMVLRKVEEYQKRMIKKYSGGCGECSSCESYSCG